MNGRALFRSLLDTYPVALGVGLPAVVLVYADMRGLSSNGFLFAGLAFQLLGLLTVVVGIGQTRAEFGDSWNVAIRGWLERTAIAAGLKEAPPNRLSMSGTMPSPTMRGEMTDDLPADASPDQRFAFLRKQIEWLRKRIQTMELSVEREREDRTAAIEVERNERRAGDSEVGQKIARLAMGGVDLSLLGAFWLGFGIVFATVPEQLACWFRV